MARRDQALCSTNSVSAANAWLVTASSPPKPDSNVEMPCSRAEVMRSQWPTTLLLRLGCPAIRLRVALRRRTSSGPPPDHLVKMWLAYTPTSRLWRGSAGFPARWLHIRTSAPHWRVRRPRVPRAWNCQGRPRFRLPGTPCRRTPVVRRRRGPPVPVQPIRVQLRLPRRVIAECEVLLLCEAGLAGFCPMSGREAARAGECPGPSVSPGLPTR